MDRTITSYDQEGNITDIDYRDTDWILLKLMRESNFRDSDLWMLADRYAQLTEEQQTELVEYRQALRDITNYFDENDDTDGANNAADNFPIAPDWMEM